MAMTMRMEDDANTLVRLLRRTESIRAMNRLVPDMGGTAAARHDDTSQGIRVCRGRRFKWRVT
jgi:hypothetical protein